MPIKDLNKYYKFKINMAIINIQEKYYKKDKDIESSVLLRMYHLLTRLSLII